MAFPGSTAQTAQVDIIIPVYNEEEAILPFHNRLRQAITDLPYRFHLFYINDGSTDGTARQLEAITAEDACVSVIELSRNFGHQAALTAGLDHASGDFVITMDGDGQHPPELIGELSCEFGAQAVVLAIDARRENEGWVVRVRGGRAATGLDAEEWALRGVELGAGEILLTSMDRDGTQSGFDIALTAAISRAVSVPLIASGGAKIPQHFLEIFTQGSADAALAASIFHDQVQSIRALKSYLKENGVEVRLPC